VRVLGAILRLSESLDRSRHGMVRTLQVSLRGDRAVVHLQTRGDAELEVWAAQRQREPLEHALDRPVAIEARVVDEPEEERPARRGRRAGAPATESRAAATRSH
jgi:hypothetical protein